MPFIWTTTPQPLPPVPTPVPSTAISYKVDVVANSVNTGGSLLYNTSTAQYDIVYPTPNIPDANITISTFNLINASFANITVSYGNSFNALVANISSANIGSITANTANVAVLYSPTIITGNVSADPTDPLGIASKQYADSLAGSGVGYETGQIDLFTKSVPTISLQTGHANVSRTTYASLYSAIGETFGSGDGSTTFGLPVVYSETESAEVARYPITPFSRAGGGITQLADGRFVLIMGDSDNGPSNTCYLAALTPNPNVVWQVCTSYPDLGLRGHGTHYLPNDGRVLVTGGYTGQFIRQTCYFGTFTANSNVVSWAQGTSLPDLSMYHAYGVTSDNRAMIVGGVLSGLVVTDRVLFGSISGTTITWSTGTALPYVVQQARMVMLSDGRAFIAGGLGVSNKIQANTYFGTISGTSVTWARGTDMPYEARSPNLTLLADGRLLLNGGTSNTSNFESNTFIGTISGTSITWTQSTPAPLNTSDSITCVDSTGAAWQMGGYSQVNSTTIYRGVIQQNNEINWTPQQATIHTLNPLPNNYIIHIGGVPAINGTSRVLIGQISGNVVSWTDGPRAPSMTSVAGAPDGISAHTTTSLPDNRLLIIGGTNTLNTTLPTLFYNNTTFATVNTIANTIDWVSSNALPTGLLRHKTILLPDNRILVTGGRINASQQVSNTWFGTITGNNISWAAGSPLPNAVFRHGVSVLTDGRIFLTGGADVATRAQTYFGTINANTITWSFGPWLPTASSGHYQQTLRDGRVLVAGGSISNVMYGLIGANSTQVTWIQDVSLPLSYVDLQGCVTTDGTIVLHGGAVGTNRKGDTFIYTQPLSGVYP